MILFFAGNPKFLPSAIAEGTIVGFPGVFPLQGGKNQI